MAARPWTAAPDEVLLELDAIDEELREVDALLVCRYCHCTEKRACFPGEWWVSLGVCASCAAIDALNRGPRR